MQSAYMIMLILSIVGFAFSTYTNDNRAGWVGMIFLAVAHMVIGGGAH